MSDIYKTISDYIDVIISQENDIISNLYDISSDLSNLSYYGKYYFSREYSDQVLEDYNISVINQYDSIDLKNAVKNLNDYILSTSGQGDLDSYLSNESLKIKPNFGKASNFVDQTVSVDNYEYLSLLDGQLLSIESGPISISFNGKNNQYGTINIYNNNFFIGLVNDRLVFDIGGSDEYTFTEIGETVTISIDDNLGFDLEFTGLGSFFINISDLDTDLSSSSDSSSSSSLSSFSSLSEGFTCPGWDEFSTSDWNTFSVLTWYCFDVD